MSEESGWLIERAGDGRPEWLGISGSYASINEGGFLFWTPHAIEALRFGRRQDAILFLNLQLSLQERLPHRETTRGLRSGDPVATVTEHIWSDGE